MSELNRGKAILFLGLPGSGKTTQSLRLAENFGFVHLTTSRIIRDAFHAIPLGVDPKIDEERVRYDAGKIVDPGLVSAWVIEAVERLPETAQGLILDGSPRSCDEAERLFPALAVRFGKENVVAFHLMISPETAFERTSARLVCVRCEKTYAGKGYGANMRCEDASCSGILSRKLLDDPAVFAERLRVFEENTKGALDFFYSRGLLSSIDGGRGPDEIFQEIFTVLQK